MIDLNNIESILNKLNEIELDLPKEYELNDRSVPRVTEILSEMLHNDNLMEQ